METRMETRHLDGKTGLLAIFEPMRLRGDQASYSYQEQNERAFEITWRKIISPVDCHVKQFQPISWDGLCNSPSTHFRKT